MATGVAAQRSVFTTAVLGTLAALLAVSACGVEPDVTASRSEPSTASAPGTSAPDPGTPAPEPGTPAAPDPESPPPSDDDPAAVPPVADAPAPDPTTPPPVVPQIRGGTSLAEVAEVGDAKEPRPYDDFVAAALADIEEWMAEIHPEIHGEPWEPLAGGVYPSYLGRTDIPGCGEANTDPADVAEFVAFYCSGGDFMVYDDGPDSLLGELTDEFGASVMGVVLAHEYGHVVQDRTGDLSRNLPTILVEQQADCVAGAWVRRAATGGSPHVVLTDLDIRGALITMVAVRDPVGTDQFESGGHGSAFDRIGAFQEGYVRGAERCAELLEDPLPLMPNQFQSTADLLNDGDLPFGYDEGQIAPLIVRTLNGFWPFQLAELDADSFAPMMLTPVDEASEITCSVQPRLVAPGLATCVADGVVFLDDGFARRLYADPIVGSADFAVGYLIALAWADVAQTQLGSTLVGSERALANDCLVGAWTRDLDPQRPPRPDEGLDRGIISPGDLDEAVVAAIEIGDTSSSDDVLGTPFEKIDAFRAGVLGQIDACLDRLDP
jgi:predicted metalloprotease